RAQIGLMTDLAIPGQVHPRQRGLPRLPQPRLLLPWRLRSQNSSMRASYLAPHDVRVRRRIQYWRRLRQFDKPTEGIREAHALGGGTRQLEKRGAADQDR